MANIASSKKDARRSAVRAVANRSVRSSVKTRVVKVRRALADSGEGIAELAATALAALDRAAAKGILHRNNAARRKSRLMKRLNATGAEATAPAKAAPAKKAAAKPAAGSPASKAGAKKAGPKKAMVTKPAAKKATATKSKK